MPVQIFHRLDAGAATEGRDGMMQAADVGYDDEIELETQPLVQIARWKLRDDEGCTVD